MKKSLFYLFMLMAVAAMPLTSCNKDPQTEEVKKHDSKSDEDQIKATTYDALSWLQGCLVVVDKNDNVVRRVYGEVLDESQPDVISVPVADYSAAEKLFLNWVAPDKEATKVDGGYDYYLTNTQGKAQGSVSFRPDDCRADLVARMTVSEGTGLKQISEVEFIKYDLWPENAAYQKYEAGKIYDVECHELSWKNPKFEAILTTLPFYCVQSNTNGKEAILVWISPDDDDPNAHPAVVNYINSALEYLPTEEEADRVLEFYNNNGAFWADMLKEMDAKGYKWSPIDSPWSTNKR